MSSNKTQLQTYKQRISVYGKQTGNGVDTA